MTTATTTALEGPLAQLRRINDVDRQAILNRTDTSDPNVATLGHALAAAFTGRLDVARQILASGIYSFPEGPDITPVPVTVEAFVDSLDEHGLYAVLARAEERIEAQNRAAFPDAVDEWFKGHELAECVEDIGRPVKIVWGTTGYDNGYFFESATAVITFPEAETVVETETLDQHLTGIRNDQPDDVTNWTTLTYTFATRTYTVD